MKNQKMQNKDLNIFMEGAVSKIAPSWPLKDAVAVNPYMGLTDMSFQSAAQYLESIKGIQTVMPLTYYLDQLENNTILRSDLKEALQKNGYLRLGPMDVINIARQKQTEPNQDITANTYVQLLSRSDKVDWLGFLRERMSFWAADYFQSESIEEGAMYAHWYLQSSLDRSARILGMSSIKQAFKTLPDTMDQALDFLEQEQILPGSQRESYLHSVLLNVNGWASYVAGLDWQEKLYGGSGNHLKEFLLVLMAWEYLFREEIKHRGLSTMLDQTIGSELQTMNVGGLDQMDLRLIFQDALDIASRRKLVAKFKHTPKGTVSQKSIKAVFCIDVRSEPFRRNLEKVDPSIDTVGFAGFFGFPVQYKRMLDKTGTTQGPALIPTAFETEERFANPSVQSRYKETIKNRGEINRVWKRFKSEAVSSFAFVSPMGLGYLPKLLKASAGKLDPVPNPYSQQIEKEGRTIDLEGSDKELLASLAANALKGMGLATKLPDLVMLFGHTAKTVNNPHSATLECGACGGHSGEVNALTAATVLNHPDIRLILEDKFGIRISPKTFFLAGIHNTTTDEIDLLNDDALPQSHIHLLPQLRRSLSMAGTATRRERAVRFGFNANAPEKDIFRRSKDWSEVRPEWGLAGCHSIVVAPRHRSSGLDLEGKVFLHTYDQDQDPEGKVLEGILTAPVVVASWINLQYYASTTDPQFYGAGNKTLHNAMAGIGVLEGAAGDLRIGLPWQSVHNGNEFQHQPAKLKVVVEAQENIVTPILTRNPQLKQLFDNQWIYLLLMDENGKINKQYDKSQWLDLDDEGTLIKELQEQSYQLN